MCGSINLGGLTKEGEKDNLDFSNLLGFDRSNLFFYTN